MLINTYTTPNAIDLQTRLNTSVDTGTNQRRAAAWLKTRLDRGAKERFCEIVNVTPAIAAELLHLNTHNRRPLTNAIREYSDAMARGMWRLTAEALSVSDDRVLINGQNRLLAVIDSGCTVPLTLWFGCERAEFEVADGARKRGADQQLAIMGVVNPVVAAALGKQLWRIKTRITTPNPSVREVLQFTLGLDQAALVDATRYGQSMSAICAPTAAALAYWHIVGMSPNATRLEEFRTGFVEGVGLYGARAQLRNWLLNEWKERNNSGSSAKKAAGFIFAWNAWLKGQKKVPSFAWNHIIQLPDAL